MMKTYYKGQTWVLVSVSKTMMALVGQLWAAINMFSAESWLPDWIIALFSPSNWNVAPDTATHEAAPMQSFLITLTLYLPINTSVSPSALTGGVVGGETGAGVAGIDEAGDEGTDGTTGVVNSGACGTFGVVGSVGFWLSISINNIKLFKFMRNMQNVILLNLWM